MIFKQRDFKTFLWNGLRAENSVIASVALTRAENSVIASVALTRAENSAIASVALTLAENSVIASVALKKMALWTLKKRSTGDSCWLVYGRSA
jgi:hypothetical protein